MKKPPIRPLLAGYSGICALVVFSNMPIYAAPNPNQRMLSHDVYFTLKDKSDEAKEKLVAGCEKYLADHPGTVWFAAGVLVDEHQRDVNDRDYDVALHIVFKDEVSHDKYQDAPQHTGSLTSTRKIGKRYGCLTRGSTCCLMAKPSPAACCPKTGGILCFTFKRQVDRLTR